MSHTDELTRLAELHRNGDLTDEEFAAAKKGLLGATNAISSPAKVKSDSAMEPIKASNEKLLDFDSLSSSRWLSTDESKKSSSSPSIKRWMIVVAGLIVVASIALLGRHDSPTSSPVQTPTTITQPPATNESSLPKNSETDPPPMALGPTSGIGKSRSFFMDNLSYVSFLQGNDVDGYDNYVGFIGSERQCIIQLIGPADDLKSASVTVTTEESNAKALAATGDFMRRFAEIVVAGGAAWFDKSIRRAANHVTSNEFDVEKTFGNITGKFVAADWGNGIGTMSLTFSGS